jgi:hypothetical protein
VDVNLRTMPEGTEQVLLGYNDARRGFAFSEVKMVGVMALRTHLRRGIHVNRPIASRKIPREWCFYMLADVAA